MRIEARDHRAGADADGLGERVEQGQQDLDALGGRAASDGVHRGHRGARGLGQAAVGARVDRVRHDHARDQVRVGQRRAERDPGAHRDAAHDGAPEAEVADPRRGVVGEELPVERAGPAGAAGAAQVRGDHAEPVDPPADREQRGAVVGEPAVEEEQGRAVALVEGVQRGGRDLEADLGDTGHGTSGDVRSGGLFRAA